jgi:cytochrome c-type biogenesis protein CcmH/NrfF
MMMPGWALFCLLMALRGTEMRRGPFVGIRQPMNVTAAMLWCSPFRLACATAIWLNGLRRSSPGQG